MTPPRKGSIVNGSTLIDFEGTVALWKFNSGSGFGIYLYENGWQMEDHWLLWASKRDEKDAREVYDRVR